MSICYSLIPYSLTWAFTSASDIPVRNRTLNYQTAPPPLSVLAAWTLLPASLSRGNPLHTSSHLGLMSFLCHLSRSLTIAPLLHPSLYVPTTLTTSYFVPQVCTRPPPKSATLVPVLFCEVSPYPLDPFLSAYSPSPYRPPHSPAFSRRRRHFPSGSRPLLGSILQSGSRTLSLPSYTLPLAQSSIHPVRDPLLTICVSPPYVPSP